MDDHPHFHIDAIPRRGRGVAACSTTISAAVPPMVADGLRALGARTGQTPSALARHAIEALIRTARQEDSVPASTVSRAGIKWGPSDGSLRCGRGRHVRCWISAIGGPHCPSHYCFEIGDDGGLGAEFEIGFGCFRAAGKAVTEADAEAYVGAVAEVIQTASIKLHDRIDNVRDDNYAALAVAHDNLKDWRRNSPTGDNAVTVWFDPIRRVWAWTFACGSVSGDALDRQTAIDCATAAFDVAAIVATIGTKMK